MTSTDSDRAEALAQALDAVTQAWAQGDMVMLNAMLSSTYSHVDAFGARHSRTTWLTYATKRKGRKTQTTLRDVATRFFGDIAVITGFTDITGGGATGPDDDKDLTLAFTQVWRWDDGQWLREAFQATPVATKPLK